MTDPQKESNGWMTERMFTRGPTFLSAWLLGLEPHGFLSWLLPWDTIWENQGSSLSVMRTAQFCSRVVVKDWLQRQCLRQEAAVAGTKAGENERASQCGDNRTPETHKKPSSPHATSLARSSLLTALLLALWEDEVRWFEISLVAPDGQLKAKWDVGTRMDLLNVLQCFREHYIWLI